MSSLWQDARSPNMGEEGEYGTEKKCPSHLALKLQKKPGASRGEGQALSGGT